MPAVHADRRRGGDARQCRTEQSHGGPSRPPLNRHPPDRWDVLGAAFCLVGALVIIFAPRGE
ncbi:hypothetical protein [Magnetospirillum sp. SS-4]|uniref:hypothetical protein n=1 Tax=Magnetospirillum sp. SS-4 TaxID=2681465 RepID=UPI0034CDA2AF